MGRREHGPGSAGVTDKDQVTLAFNCSTRELQEGQCHGDNEVAGEVVELPAGEWNVRLSLERGTSYPSMPGFLINFFFFNIFH